MQQEATECKTEQRYTILPLLSVYVYLQAAAPTGGHTACIKIQFLNKNKTINYGYY